MKIWIDGDACPVAIREILYRASGRLSLPLTLVANSWIRLPASPLMNIMVVSEGPDVADDKIAELCAAGDLVITADIPLAARIIEKQGHVITPRGEVLDGDTIKERLVMRDFMDELRGAGVETGGPKPMKAQDNQKFAAALDSLLARL